MIEREDIVAAVIAAAGGELTGRVRLQKTVYLLDRLGLNSRFGFEYHHYGPFSRDLDNATADAKAFGLVDEKFEHRQSDGAAYSVFKLTPEAPTKSEAYGSLGETEAGKLVKLFGVTNVTVLELAATVDWLWRFEHVRDWKSEIRKRKGVKVQGGRLEEAIKLLGTLGLNPPAVADAA